MGKSIIRRALNRVTQGQKLSAPVTAPVVTLAPVTASVPTLPGHDDELMIFRSALLRREKDGATLRDAFDHMAQVHPARAGQVVAQGSLGELSWVEATGVLRTYAANGVALTPVQGL